MNRRRYMAANESGGGSVAKMKSGEYYYSDGTISSNLISGKTVLGVCVVPASHMEDGYPRIMALWDIDSSGNKVTTQNYDSVCKWGATATDISNILTSTKLPSTTSNYTYSSDASTGYLGTTKPLSNMIFSNDGLYYASRDHICCPYLQDGTANPDYRKNGYATSDFKGWENTSYLNSSAYQAGYACLQYAPTAETMGHWYLPAAGELGYVVYNLKDTNEMMTDAGGCALVSTADERSYWSSTEYSNTYSWNVDFDFGQIFYENRGYSKYVRPFLAVWTL